MTVRTPPRPARGERVYRALLRLHPPAFRRAYGDDLVAHFRDWLRDERARRGALGVAAVWTQALADLFISASRSRLERRAVHAPSLATPPAGDTMLATLAHDLRFAARMLRKSPTIALAAVLVIALGTGAVSTIFSVANAIVLRPLPGVRDVGSVVTVGRTRAHGDGTLSASYPYYRALAERSRRMQGVAAWSMVQLTASTGGQGVTALGNIVSGNYFTVLGATPALGRFFAPDETRPGTSAPVVVVSHAFWRRELGSDSAVVGRTLFVNGHPLTIVGVAAPRFAGLFPMLRTDLWVPLALQPQLRPNGDLTSAGTSWLELFGRVAPHVARADAQAELEAITRAWTREADEPERLRHFTGVRLSRASGLPSDVSDAVLGFFVVLLAVSGLVLLIASVNVAGMLLARTVARRREVAVRLALGARRARLARQLVTENLLLFAAGGAGGVVLAEWGTRALGRVELPVEVPLALDVAPDVRVLVATLVVALLTGVVVALGPALRATRLDPSAGLRGDDARSGRARSRLRDALVVGQVAASLVLLAAAGLFVRALDRGRRVDPGFDVTHVATAAFDVGTAGYDEPRGRAFQQALAERMAAYPGVTSVAYARVLPLSMNTSGTEISVPGYTPPGGARGDAFPVALDEVDGGYFATTRTPLALGRPFHASDDAGAAPVAIVNETFARRVWPDGAAVGRSFRLDDRTITVVGVVRDTKFSKLDETPEPFLYLPVAQRWRPSLTLLVRTTGDAAALAEPTRRTVAALDPRFPAPTITTLEQSTSVMLLPQRFAVAVTGALGVVGLLLATIGLYGVLSFSAAQRTREMGVRLALGARRRDVVRLVVGEGGRLIAIGLALGLVLALAAARALTPFLFGVSPADPLTFVAIGATLAAVALVASWIPARRAARVDPVTSLRDA